MPFDYVICVRSTENNAFTNKSGTTTCLAAPQDTAENTAPFPLSPAQAIDRDQWMRGVIAEAITSVDLNDPTSFGDILVFIHGFNDTQAPPATAATAPA